MHRFDQLKRIADRYDNDAIVVLGVNDDQTLESAISAAGKLPIETRHWYDANDKIFSRWSGSWPSTQVVDKNGILRYWRNHMLIKSLEEIVDQLMQPE
jgi:Tfp pilus assembly pilus retraction ATPase PilT